MLGRDYPKSYQQQTFVLHAKGARVSFSLHQTLAPSSLPDLLLLQRKPRRLVETARWPVKTIPHRTRLRPRRVSAFCVGSAQSYEPQIRDGLNLLIMRD